jgi:5'-phosphate synthase pdxT subunit
MTIGVLALQGDFDAHRKILEGCAGVSRVVPVRSAEELNGCDGLIIPGGESTVMSRLCDRYGLWEPLSTRIEQGMGAFGTCAGLILLSKNIEGGTRNFQQKTLGVLDVDTARNAYGAQLDSFETDVALQPHAASANEATSEYSEADELGTENEPEATLHAVFIRAPRITRCGNEVRVLATHEGEPVVVQQGRIMAAAFHPEIAGDARLHELWLRSLASATDSPNDVTPQKQLATKAAAEEQK